MKGLVLGLVAAILTLGVTTAYAADGGDRRGHHGGSIHHGGGFHHGGEFHHAGLFFGVGPHFLFSRRPFFYPQRRAISVAPAPPTAYVQQPRYWYYCRDPEGYYPYVNECPSGWMQVVPQSPPQ